MEPQENKHFEKFLLTEIARVEQKFEARLEGMDRALTHANSILQERFHQINGLREEVVRERVEFASKDAAKVAAIIYALLIVAVGILAFFK